MKKNKHYSFYIILLFLVFILACSRNKETSEFQNIDSIKLKKTDKIVRTVVFDTIAGKIVYQSKCIVCHQENGLGVSGTFPPLAGSDHMLFDKKRALKNVIHGVKEPIVVNGQTYRGNTMPDIEMSDKELKDVMDYILNSWGNKGGTISMEDVKAARNN
jgi:mono/diheme cytochrome c family protein